MGRSTHCLGLALIFAWFAAPAQSQITYSFQSTSGIHPFNFYNGFASIYTPITLHDSVDNTNTAAILWVFLPTNPPLYGPPARLTGGASYDQPVGGHFIIFDAQRSQELLNAYFSGDIVGSFGISSAVCSGDLLVNGTSLSLGLWPDYPTFSFSLTSIPPTLFLSPTGSLTDFNADFSAQITDVPEPRILPLVMFLPLIFRRRCGCT